MCSVYIILTASYSVKCVELGSPHRNFVDFWYIKAFDYKFFLNRVLFDSDHRHLLLQEVPLLTRNLTMVANLG